MTMTSSSIMQLTLLGLLLLTHCAQQVHAGKEDIFFFGNSFTAYASFTYRVRRFYNSKFSGIPRKDRPRVDTPRHTRGGANLWTHLRWMQNSENKKKPNFALDRWEWCVIQDQSITPAIPQWRYSNQWAANGLAAYCKDNDVPVMFMMTWGYRYNVSKHGVRYDYPGMTAALFEGYNMYVEASSLDWEEPAYMAPCGLTWERVYQDCVDEGKDPRGDDCMWKQLYNKDGSHPGGKGATLCAMTMAVAMTGISPYKMHYNPNENGHIGGKLVQDIMRDAVYRVITETYESGLIKYPFDEPLEPRNPNNIWRPISTPPEPDDDPSEEPPEPIPTPVPDIETNQVKTFFLGTNLVVGSDKLDNYFKKSYEDAIPDSQVTVGIDSISGTLEDHYYGTYMNQESDADYDWVVLQEATGLASLDFYLPGEFMHNLITGLRGRNAMFMMPWAFQNGRDHLTFEEQTANLMGNTRKLVDEAAMAGLKVYMAPVGLAFEVVHLDCQEPPGCDFDLHQDNGRNANKSGQYLAAITLMAAMTGEDPDEINFRPDGISQDRAEHLRDAARRAILLTLIDSNPMEYPWDTSEWETTDFLD